MQNWAPILVISVVILWMMAGTMWSRKRHEQRLDALRAVLGGQEYANHHQVAGVGYYHAATGRWYERPWNEYREGQGYFWDGRWRPKPDQRHVASSIPQPGEIERVNSLWFAANPEKLKQFNDVVERSGFGGSNERTSGS